MSFTKIGVVGLGTMGAGIAEVLARSGLEVVGVEIDDAGLERGREHIEHSTARAVSRGKLTEPEQSALLTRISFGTDVTAVKDCELVIEAIPERMELKCALFAELDKLLPEDAVLATNTSALSVTELATTTSRPLSHRARSSSGIGAPSLRIVLAPSRPADRRSCATASRMPKPLRAVPTPTLVVLPCGKIQA